MKKYAYLLVALVANGGSLVGQDYGDDIQAFRASGAEWDSSEAVALQAQVLQKGSINRNEAGFCVSVQRAVEGHKSSGMISEAWLELHAAKHPKLESMLKGKRFDYSGWTQEMLEDSVYPMIIALGKNWDATFAQSTFDVWKATGQATSGWVSFFKRYRRDLTSQEKYDLCKAERDALLDVEERTADQTRWMRELGWEMEAYLQDVAEQGGGQ